MLVLNVHVGLGWIESSNLKWRFYEGWYVTWCNLWTKTGEPIIINRKFIHGYRKTGSFKAFCYPPGRWHLNKRIDRGTNGLPRLSFSGIQCDTHKGARFLINWKSCVVLKKMFCLFNKIVWSFHTVLFLLFRGRLRNELRTRLYSLSKRFLHWCLIPLTTVQS